jgi:hypothetical protein
MTRTLRVCLAVCESMALEIASPTDIALRIRGLHMTVRAFSWALGATVVLLGITGQPVRARQIADAPHPAECEMSLETIDQSWKGLCGPIFGNEQPTTLTATKVASLPGGAGRDGVPTLMLAGKLTGRRETSDVELEFFDQDGVIRTQGPGWRVVIVISESATRLRFRVTDTPPEPNELDRLILQRAAEILATEAVWDRADDRDCAPDAKTWSMYCALRRASLEVTGGFHNRRPCLQILRQVLYERVAEERKNGRKYPHIVMDYNNDAKIRLADIQTALTDAAARIKW